MFYNYNEINVNIANILHRDVLLNKLECCGQMFHPSSFKAQCKGVEMKPDKGRCRKITSGNAQTWSLISPAGRKEHGKWRVVVAELYVVLQ